MITKVRVNIQCTFLLILTSVFQDNQQILRAPYYDGIDNAIKIIKRFQFGGGAFSFTTPASPQYPTAAHMKSNE